MTYVVKRGDTFSKIAAAHGVTLGAMIRANPQVRDPSLIILGQVLNIPVASPTGGEASFTEVYRVRSGDSMRKIAAAYGVSLSALIAANPQISDPKLIRKGDLINVPTTDPSSSVQLITEPPAGDGPLWYRLARRELKTEEIPGDVHNPRIIEYHASVSTGFDTNEIHWCSSFVNWCMEQSHITGTNSAKARSWEKWGKKLAEPKLGAVAVFWRDDKASGLGHVGFFVKTSGSDVMVLGGNQGDRVSVAGYPKARLLSYRWPK